MVDAACFPGGDRGALRHVDDDVCMSDRLVPSRGTCLAMNQMKLEDDQNLAPRNEYQEVVSQNVLGKECFANTKVLSYRHKPPRQEQGRDDYKVLYCAGRDAGSRPRAAVSRVVPQAPMRILDAPNIVDDFYSHPIDWSSNNVVGVAISETVYLFDAESGQTEKLLALDAGNVTAVRWTGKGDHMAVGTSDGEVQIWDICAQRQLRTFQGHSDRIGALAWHQHVLSSGARDAEIHQHDVRMRHHLMLRRSDVHADVVCGLDYNAEGLLASGSNDNAVCIWDTPTAATPIHTLTEHCAAVKAVRWCPWQRSVLATGGGSADRQICLWNAASGRLLMSADAESQVTGIVWGTQDKELLTSHGYWRNQLSLWKYPSLVKVADLEGHRDRVLGIAQSPDGSLVSSISADETLRFWQVFSPHSAGQRGCADSAVAPRSILKTIR